MKNQLFAQIAVIYVAVLLAASPAQAQQRSFSLDFESSAVLTDLMNERDYHGGGRNPYYTKAEIQCIHGDQDSLFDGGPGEVNNCFIREALAWSVNPQAPLNLRRETIAHDKVLPKVIAAFKANVGEPNIIAQSNFGYEGILTCEYTRADAGREDSAYTINGCVISAK